MLITQGMNATVGSKRGRATLNWPKPQLIGGPRPAT
jgi:hypothetical protein